MLPKITPFLWFDNQAEQAVDFYLSVFPEGRIVRTVRYGEAGPGPAGSVMTIEFEMLGQRFTALNGGPVFQFNEAISFVIDCESQPEIDHYWEKLTAGGKPSRCGWLQDRYGVSWQVVPTVLVEMISDSDPQKSQRVVQAMMQMVKIDISQLQAAFEHA